MKPTRRLTIWIYIQAALTALNVVFGALTGDWKSWAVAALCLSGGVALIGARCTVRKANELRRVTSAGMENGVWES